MPAVSQIAAFFHKNRKVAGRCLHDFEERGLIEVTGLAGRVVVTLKNTTGMTEHRGDVLLK